MRDPSGHGATVSADWRRCDQAWNISTPHKCACHWHWLPRNSPHNVCIRHNIEQALAAQPQFVEQGLGPLAQRPVQPTGDRCVETVRPCHATQQDTAGCNG